MRSPLLWFCLFGLVFFTNTGCNDDTGTDPEGPSNFVPGGGFFISLEGTFQAGNASLDYFSLAKSSSDGSVFRDRTGLAMGDVLQSMSLWNGSLYLVVNNSQKIEIVRASDFEYLGSITGLVSPRYLLPVSNQKAFLTDLFANQVYVLDLTTNTLTDSIATDYWTEELVESNDRIFVSQRLSDKVLVIDRFTNEIIDSVVVGYDPSSLVVDRNGAVWTLCSGSSDAQAGLYQINQTTLEVERSLLFNEPLANGWPRLITNEEGDQLYYLTDACYTLSIDANEVPTEPIIDGNGHQWYALGWEPQLGHLLLGDAIDFQQMGLAYRYLPDGSPVDSFRVGVIPNGFLSF
ncbi:MAG: DUF5074 domain-containing protein [Bacteroidota bacterium]